MARNCLNGFTATRSADRLHDHLYYGISILVVLVNYSILVSGQSRLGIIILSCLLCPATSDQTQIFMKKGQIRKHASTCGGCSSSFPSAPPHGLLQKAGRTWFTSVAWTAVCAPSLSCPVSVVSVVHTAGEQGGC